MPDAPFTVPYPQHSHFVGREDDLARLHAALQGKGPVGINPAAMGNPTGVTGQGGIGKTQLAVEYAYRYREHYPDGVYWLNAAESLFSEFANLGRHFLGQGGEETLKVRLWETLHARFSVEEIRNLCFELGINYEEFSPKLGVSSLARELVAYCQRHDKLALLEGIVRRLRGDLAQLPAQDELVLAAFAWLRQRPRSLVIFDNVADPAALDEPLTRDCVPARLPGRVLFTTRRRALGRFRPIKLKALPPKAALKLLLRDPFRQPVIALAHPEHAIAVDICNVFGHLPLALEIAAAHLANKRTRSLAEYRQELRRRGALDVAADPSIAVHTRHETGLLAALAAQWATLSKEAKLLLGVAGQLPEAAYIPTARLGLLAGLSDQIGDYFGVTLADALSELDDSSLTEELLSEQVRLHPLIREFAHKQISDAAQFCEKCVRRLLVAFSDIVTLERHYEQRGIDALIKDLLSAHAYLDSILIQRKFRVELSYALRMHLRVMRLEAHNLRDWRFADVPRFLAQQLQIRLFYSGLPALYNGQAERLHSSIWKMRWSARHGSESLVATLVGHTGAVLGVATISDDRAVSCSNDGVLKLWDLLTGSVERTLAGNWGWVRTVAVTPDGTRAIFGSLDNELHVWNLTNGLVERTLSGHKGGVNAILLSSDGHRVISGSRDGTIRMWDLMTGEPQDVLPNVAGEIRALAVTHDELKLISLTYDGRLRVWNVKSGRIEQVLVTKKRVELTSVLVSRDGHYVLAGAVDGTISIWDLKHGRELRDFKVHERGIRTLSLTRDSEQVIAGAEDGKIIVLDYLTGRVLQTIVGHGDWVDAIAVTASGHFAITGSWDQTLKVWDLTTKKVSVAPSNHKAAVNALAVTPDGSLAISAGQDQMMRIWNIKTGQLAREIFEPNGSVRYITITTDGLFAISRVVDGTIRIWNLRTWEDEWTMHDRYSTVLTVFQRSDPSVHKPTWSLSNLHNGREVSIAWVAGWKGPRDLPLPVASTKDGRHAVFASSNGTLELPLKKRQPRILKFDYENVSALAVTEDGSRIIAGFLNGTLRVINAATGKVRIALTGHNKAVHAVALTPDGLRVVSGSADATIRMWDVNSGSLLACVAFESAITCLSVLPKLPLTVVAGDATGSVYCLEWVE